jgi:hypothetical protein
MIAGKEADMKDLVRCKACGYIMEGSRLGDKCPACGVPAKQFEPYEDKVSEKRRRLLDLHVHPIVVHIPQAFSPFLVLLGLALAVATGDLRVVVLDAARVLALTLPLSVILAFAAGVFDGKLRFRRTSTPILVRKIVVASIFLAASIAGALLAVLTGLDGPGSLVPFIALQAIGLAAAVFLGFLGFPLIVAKFPG